MAKFYRSISFILLLLPAVVGAQPPSSQDSSRVMTYLAISAQHYDADRMDSARYYCLKAGEVARATNFSRGFADFASHYIPILNREGKYQEALAVALESLEKCKVLGDKSMLAVAYNNVG